MASVSVAGDGQVLGDRRGAAVSGGHVQLFEIGALPEFDGDGVLARAAADDHDAGGICDRGGVCQVMRVRHGGFTGEADDIGVESAAASSHEEAAVVRLREQHAVRGADTGGDETREARRENQQRNAGDDADDGQHERRVTREMPPPQYTRLA